VQITEKSLIKIGVQGVFLPEIVGELKSMAYEIRKKL
jgi:hypothetical protein